MTAKEDLHKRSLSLQAGDYRFPNPYPVNSLKWHIWTEGWNAACNEQSAIEKYVY